ncbi:MAG TPA: DUF72 domain-containing protein, partial [Candidatus Thermoplasmatota archaeon]|nr:DUF72 domain-containing protein [Candidatus Thermoplasmatota archaeon]
MRLRFALGSWSNSHFEHTLYPLRTPHPERLGRYASVFDAVELDILHHQQAEEGKLEDWVRQVPEGFAFLPKMHKAVTHGEPEPAAAVQVPNAAKGDPEMVRRARQRVEESMAAAARAQARPPTRAPRKQAPVRQQVSPDERVPDVPAVQAGTGNALVLDVEARKRLAVRFLDDLRPLRDAGVLGPVLLQFPPSLRREQGWDLLVRLLSLAEPGHFACEFRHASWFVPAVERVLEDTETPLVWSTVPKA